MALIRCKECGKEISGTAERCPHCGYQTARGRLTAQNKGMAILALVQMAEVAIGFYLLISNMETFLELLENWSRIHKYASDYHFFEYLSDKEQMGVFFKVLIACCILIGGTIGNYVSLLKLRKESEVTQQEERTTMQAYNNWKEMELRGQDVEQKDGMVKCQKCGKIQPRSAMCASCYAPLVTLSEPGRWRCVECGMENMLNVKTCQNCGVTKEWSDANR